jgi:hypothetical protein
MFCRHVLTRHKVIVGVCKGQGANTMTATSDDATPTFYAARLDGQDGWTLGETACAPERIVGELEDQGRRVKELRVLGSGGAQHFGVYGVARRSGWYQDEYAQCWRAPDEQASMPAGPPTWCEHL